MKTVTYDETEWKLVPKEPNRAMVLAGEGAWDTHLDTRLNANDGKQPFANYPSEETHELCSRVAYRAILAAAPTPPADGQAQQDTNKARVTDYVAETIGSVATVMVYEDFNGALRMSLLKYDASLLGLGQHELYIGSLGI